MASSEGDAERQRSLQPWAQRLLPWLATALIVALLLRRYSLSLMIDYLRVEGAWLLVPLALAGSVVSLGLMSTAEWLVWRPSLGPLRWRTAVRGRGGMGVLAALSYHAGQGGVGVWLARITGATPARAAGIVAYLMLLDLVAVCLIATTALWITGLPVTERLRWLALVIAPAVAGALLVLALAGPRLMAVLRSRFDLPARVESLMTPWSAVPGGALLASLALRIANVSISTLLWFAAARAIGMRAPLEVFVTYLPIIYLVGSLPINVGPFGAVQFAWLHFFSAYAPDEQILGLQVVFGGLLLLSFVLRGLPFVARVSRDISEGARAIELRSSASDGSAVDLMPATSPRATASSARE
jgi:hypothetical protein